MGLRRRTVLWSVPALIAASASGGRAGNQQVGGLPNAHGRTFASLDDYLAFLKQRGTMDIPYYELQPDGRYLFVRGRGTMNDPHYFTRQQLLEKFGFAE